MMNLHSENNQKTSYSSPDPLCLNNASLNALQNLRPWVDGNEQLSSANSPISVFSTINATSSEEEHNQNTDVDVGGEKFEEKLKVFTEYETGVSNTEGEKGSSNG